MHTQEIYKVMCSKYGYIALNREFDIIEHSGNIFNFFHTDRFDVKKTDIFELMPEFIGLEREFLKILNAHKNSLLIPRVLKASGSYINIHIHQGRKNSSSSGDTVKYETLIVLLENVTRKTETEKEISQERNEKVLLLDEIAEKNRQLKRYNEQMQELVQVETRKNLEKQKMVELQSRHAQIGEMIGMVTHQWKQPLNTISMVSYGLQVKHENGKLDDTTISKFIQQLRGQTAHMSQTINDFQNFFNPTKEKIQFNLHATLFSVLSLVQYEYEINDIALELVGDESVTAYGFPNEYNQVILAILSNAKDAFLVAPHGTMKIIIAIDRYDEEYSIVTIRDNAGGIPDDVIDTIFDIYITTKPTGSGLGLNIAKTIIEVNMGGELNVCNVDNGAEFSIKCAETRKIPN